MVAIAELGRLSETFVTDLYDYRSFTRATAAYDRDPTHAADDPWGALVMEIDFDRAQEARSRRG